ncbi:MAG TPA: hypothetical protein VHH36_07205, partial [Candidatus Thermoplasmatota archaeon]|nr:hypothetical protein [Candidatus Thermoplasmatota archaeon]
VLLDKSRPHEPGPNVDAKLMDAWTRDHPGPAVYVGSPFPDVAAVPLLDGYYLAPGGPGLGEPDVLEMMGLGAYVEWLQMENHSPMHETKGRVLDAAERLLRERYGDRVVIQRSYHVEPKVGRGESDAEAAEAFRAAGVPLVVDAYTTTVFSDVMNTCMMRPHMEHAFDQAGFAGRLVHSEAAGTSPAYAQAVATRVAALLAEHPADARVAVFLTHHGASPSAKSPCSGAPDAYNAGAKALFESARAALEAADVRPAAGVFQVYGQGAGAADDGILSPEEALAKAREAGATHVLDLPYELTGDGFDNLVAQRASYGLDPRDAPHYDANRETYLTRDGMTIRIASASYETELRAEALVDAIARALGEGVSGDGHAHEH